MTDRENKIELLALLIKNGLYDPKVALTTITNDLMEYICSVQDEKSFYA
jgi:hypothetical protein